MPPRTEFAPHPILLKIPNKDYRRAKLVARRLHVTVTALAREGLFVRLAEAEKKIRVEDALAEVDKQVKKPRGLGSLGGIGESKLAPTPLKSYNEQQQESAKNADDVTDARLDIIYRHHAVLINAALSNPIEKRLRIAEALMAVRNETPITEPPESEILATLEEYVMSLRDKKTAGPITAPPVKPSLLTTPTPISNVVSPSPLPPTRFASVMTGKTVPETTKTKK